MVDNGRMGSGTVARFAAVDRMPLLRAGIVETLKGIAECVAEGTSAGDAWAIAGRLPIDILVVDAFAVPGGGMHFVADFNRRWPAIRIVVLTADEGNAAVTGAMQSGALGFVTKDADCQELRSAVAAAVSGEAYVSPTLGARLLTSSFGAARNGSQSVRPAHPTGDLTTRELQILSQVSLGATNREIAQALNITEKTVKHYMTSIMQKLGVRNRVEAVVALRDRRQASA